MTFSTIARDSATRARAGILETPHGAVQTPAYVLVGTHGRVRTLEPPDLIAAKTQLIIANTYHLWQTLGEAGLKTYPGLHEAMNWQGPLMTDSGGFQVFSFGAAREYGAGKVAETRDGNPRAGAPAREQQNLTRITDIGVIFSAGGIRNWLDAEKSIRIQQQLGADIIIAFDEPTSPRHDYAYTRASLTRTHEWAERSLRAKTSSQLIYGVVQGGSHENLRKESARIIGAMPFDGIAVGGSYSNSFGDSRDATFRELDWVCPLLPQDKPRHLLGIGLIEDLFAGVAAGMDTFDCVVPTREGRHGSLWTRRGRVDIMRAKFAEDKTVLDEECACIVCADMKIEKGALRGLFKEKNPEAGRLATLHNICFFNNLMSRMRTAIINGTFTEFCASFFKR